MAGDGRPTRGWQITTNAPQRQVTLLMQSLLYDQNHQTSAEGIGTLRHALTWVPISRPDAVIAARVATARTPLKSAVGVELAAIRTCTDDGLTTFTFGATQATHERMRGDAGGLLSAYTLALAMSLKAMGFQTTRRRVPMRLFRLGD